MEKFTLHNTRTGETKEMDLLSALRAELQAERAESAKWRKIAERAFNTALRNAVLLADERKGKRGA